jgi:hypothetical protein
VAAIIVAMNWGFAQALALGATAYLGAFLLVRTLARGAENVTLDSEPQTPEVPGEPARATT